MKSKIGGKGTIYLIKRHIEDLEILISKMKSKIGGKGTIYLRGEI
jgi:hypothetical protein